MAKQAVEYAIVVQKFLNYRHALEILFKKNIVFAQIIVVNVIKNIVKLVCHDKMLNFSDVIFYTFALYMNKIVYFIKYQYTE